MQASNTIKKFKKQEIHPAAMAAAQLILINGIPKWMFEDAIQFFLKMEAEEDDPSSSA